MAIVADFMLVYLPAPTVSLQKPLAVSAGAIAKFFHGCPENAFQVGTVCKAFHISIFFYFVVLKRDLSADI